MRGTEPITSGPLTAARLEEIQARVSEVAWTTSDWRLQGPKGCERTIVYRFSGGLLGVGYGGDLAPPVARLFAHAIADLPDLLAEIKKLREELSSTNEELAKSKARVSKLLAKRRADKEKLAKLMGASEGAAGPSEEEDE